MTAPTRLEDSVQVNRFMRDAVAATTAGRVEALLRQLPIVDEQRYAYDPTHPEADWRHGFFHWVPVGKDRGNAGRITLANQPVNPIAERLVNGMEALIELERQREIKRSPNSQPPGSPRESVKRYFDLPPLEGIPKMPGTIRGQKPRDYARQVSKSLRVRVVWERTPAEFTVIVEDDGIGQPPAEIHETLLSLGKTTKGDKSYLIGIFGQGGSSAYAASTYSWLVSRRAKDLLDGQSDGLGWTVIKRIFPENRRDNFFAYLAAHPDGRVPHVAPETADHLGISAGTRFAHVRYDFGRGGGSAVFRNMYPALNHILFNPVLPYELYAGRDVADPMYGNAYRLSLLSTRRQKPALDKTYPPQPVG